RLAPSEVTLSKDGEILQERFNPYTGADMGDAHPRSVAIMEWFVDLHDNLLKGETGRKVNALGGALLCLMCLTGVLIWWRASGACIAWLVRMHFGRYGGMGVRITYVIIGILPAAMFVTGAIMWWNRVLRRWVAETKSSRARAAFPAHTAAEQVE